MVLSVHFVRRLVIALRIIPSVGLFFMLTACASSYKVSSEVADMNQQAALEFLSQITADHPGWVCEAGKVYTDSIDRSKDITLSGSVMTVNTADVFAKLDLVEVDTTTKRVTRGPGQLIQKFQYQMDLGAVKSMRVQRVNSLHRCNIKGAGDILAVKMRSGLTLLGSPPPALLDQTITALRTLNPSAGIKTGVGF